ncbi:MAG: hypothetical protein NUK65_11830 [Firmicutes bacterium]|nr:hypothetical protein [Bacillota bacterium]
MTHARFPATHLILPEFREIALKPQVIPQLIHREKNKQEFQRLLELSLQCGLVLQIVTTGKQSPLHTTGIVKMINIDTNMIVVQTLEGPRHIPVGEVQDIMCDE